MDKLKSFQNLKTLFIKKSKYSIVSGILTFILCISCIGTFYAQAVSPPFARSKEEWNLLEDDNLYYDEIADLIHEYNATVVSNEYDYNQWKDTYGTTAEELSMELRSMAMDLESPSQNLTEIEVIQNQALARQYRIQADENTDDATTTRWSYESAEASIVMQAKIAFVTYYLRKAQYEAANVQLEILKNSLSQTELLVSAGMATNMDLMSTRKNVSDQEVAAKSALDAIETSRQSLIIMFGWSGMDEPNIGPAPEISDETLNAINLGEDIDKGLLNNYTLKIDQRKLSNARYPEVKDELEKDIQDDDSNIRASISSAYNDLQNARLSLESANSALNQAINNASVLGVSYSAGLATALDYNNANLKMQSAQVSVDMAKLSLAISYITYSSYVDGL